MAELTVPEAIREDFKLLRRGVSEILPEQEFVDRLLQAKEQRRPLKIKVGFDPTAAHVTLGWAVILRKMRQFQDLGHEVVFLYGDFTAMIGDPSGKSKTRRQLTREEVHGYAEDYEKQIFAILDPAKTTLYYNSEWLSPLSLKDAVLLAGKYTVTQLMQREDFRKRYETGSPIGVHEFLYPLLQGYDSVQLRSDVELGGHDQKLNLLVGRELMRNYGLTPQCVMTMPLLVGTDGKMKMSQSLGNYIGIAEPPREMFGKIMSIPDELIFDYFVLCTDVDMKEVEVLQRGMQSGDTNPRDAKARLGREIVTLYHDREAATAAEEEFNRLFREKGLPDEMPVKRYREGDLPILVARVLSSEGMAASNSEARRLIDQGGVRLNDQRLTDRNHEINEKGEYVLKVGNRRFLKIQIT